MFTPTRRLISRTLTLRPYALYRPKLPQTNLLKVTQQTRSLTIVQKWKLEYKKARKDIWRKNPIFLPFALLSVAMSIAFLVYVVYIDITEVRPQYEKYPSPVAQALRRGVYYTEADLNAPKALQAYKEALRLALEMGMDPFSDEVLGIKLQVGMMLEKAGLVRASVEVLERTKGEILNFVEKGRKGRFGDEEDAEKREAYETRVRDRALKKAVGIEMRLAELYSTEHMQQEEKAEKAQVAAVELCLKEMNRRRALGLVVEGGSPDNDDWVSAMEIATALLDLAVRYTEQEKYGLATPLYVRAFDLIRAEEGDAPTCKQVVLLNGVATALAGQAQKPIRSVDPAKTREKFLDVARLWAQKSIEVAARVQPTVRDQDCDTSCVAATYNLGELAELQGKLTEAEKLYEEAKSLAQGVGFEEGIVKADKALKRVVKKW
ncbi:TPR domain protein [Aspergillus coremiiformis]|uniref:TPR domain protein n=1 Tax=Aspergillus coremiiformis TaxID=138285 RepID=A0A5N6YTT3_9EURO|nr:TPR domain protein [Aspergillus coremiiformis]